MPSHAARIERLNERLPEQESGGILNWMGRHPILSGLGLTALTMGGLALGTHTGLFQTAWLAKNAPWLNTAGQWVSTNAMKFWSWVLLSLGIKNSASALDRRGGILWDRNDVPPDPLSERAQNPTANV